MGVKLAVVPLGRPEADRLTVALNPPLPVSETVVPTDWPCVTEPDVGSTDMLKSGVGGRAVTVRV